MNPILPRAFRFLLATSALALCAASAASVRTPFSKIVVFGDSLNDYGNMTQYTGGAFPNAPDYVDGRQSNGAIWVEYLAGRLAMGDKLANYAVVGALLRATSANPSGNVWSFPNVNLNGTDVVTQIQDYIADSGGQADPSALHILEGGANDFPIVQNPSSIVTNLVACFLTLQQAGAKHILILNLPDFGKTPRAILAERTGVIPSGSTQMFSLGSAQLNQALAAAVRALAAPDVTITIADLHGFMNTVSANPTEFGMVEIVLPYSWFGTGADPAKWLFWDDLHPTTRGHQILAEHAISALIGTYSPRNGSGSGTGTVDSLLGLVRPLYRPRADIPATDL